MIGTGRGNKLHMKQLSIAGIFLALTVLVIGAMSVGRTDAYAQANQPPTVLSVVTSNTSNGTTDNYPGGSITVNSGGIKTIYLNGTVEDLDGRDTITNVRGVFHRSGASGGHACSASGNDCYVVASCGVANLADPNQKSYYCQTDLQFYSDPTDAPSPYPSENWVAHVEVTDGTDTGQDSSLTKEMNSVLSISFPGTIEFGTRSVGDSTTAGTNTEMAISQRGNINADVEVSMPSGMPCTRGTFPIGNVKWALTDVGYGSGSAISMTASPVDTNLNVAYGTDTSPSPSKFLYWNISIPVGVGGTCSGTTVISAIAH